MHLKISTEICNIKIQVQNVFRTFFGVDRASKIHVFLNVQAMGPRARIPPEILRGKILTDILTIFVQKVVSSKNSTAPRVIILLKIIKDILTFGLHFAGIFELRQFPLDSRTRPVTAWSRQRRRSNLISLYRLPICIFRLTIFEHTNLSLSRF